MNKSIFELQPNLVENEGQVVRINFDVEQTTQTIPSIDGEESEEVTVYKAYVVRVAAPATLNNVKAAIVAGGFTEYYAEEIACEVMMETSSSTSDKLAYAIQEMTVKISEYDNSTNVNEFSYQGVSMWLDKDTRNGLLMRLNAELAAGKENTTLWLGTQSFTLSITDGLAMLNALEVYASECFDNTASHKANVAALTTVKKVLAYDYTTGYPEKLSF